mmetsp:Transcript_71511/g.209609  ORF Transcript_71511/g.209609 Transcript_71511/m.209609 type:complete len:231 (+) Transcript_71511:224-916(+)
MRNRSLPQLRQSTRRCPTDLGIAIAEAVREVRCVRRRRRAAKLPQRRASGAADIAVVVLQEACKVRHVRLGRRAHDSHGLARRLAHAPIIMLKALSDRWQLAYGLLTNLGKGAQGGHNLIWLLCRQQARDVRCVRSCNLGPQRGERLDRRKPHVCTTVAERADQALTDSLGHAGALTEVGQSLAGSLPHLRGLIFQQLRHRGHVLRVQRVPAHACERAERHKAHGLVLVP